MPVIKAVIFDLDGVVTSTDKFHYLAWKRLFDELGIKFTPEDNEKIKGVGRRESFDLIAGSGFPEKSIPEYLNKKNNYYCELLAANELYPLPGISELLNALDFGGIKKAIASGSRNARLILDNLHMVDRFDVIVDGTMCQKSKPAPDIFLLAARMLSVSPCSCAVIEDSQVGIEAAAKAGMKSIGIGSLLEGADILLSSTSELWIETVLQKTS